MQNGSEYHTAVDCPKHLASVVAIQPFERDRSVNLQENGWTYRRIAAHLGHNVSVVCRCFQQWSMEHSHDCRPGSGRLHSTDAPQDWRIVRVVVAARTDPVKKSRHMLHLLCHQGPLGTVCLQQNSDHVCLWPGYHIHHDGHQWPEMLTHPKTSNIHTYLLHDTAKHGYFGVEKESTGEWNGTLLSSVMRVDSVCMWVIDVHMYGIDLVRVIFQSAFAHDTQATPQASWCGRPSVTIRGHIWHFCRVK